METLENRLQKRIHVSLYALLFLLTLLGLSVLLEGCTDSCEVSREYTFFEPVYTTVQEIRDGVQILPAQPVKEVGKIYFKEGYLFVNEPGEGIHVINNEDPAHPSARHFIKVPGNYDLAIKGNTLYADSYVDLVAFDVSNINSIREVNRLEGIFKNYQVLGYAMDTDCCVITSFKEQKRVTLTDSDCQGSTIQPWGGMWLENGVAFLTADAGNFSAKAAIAPGTGSGSGVGGSLARFTVNGDYLYLLDGGDIQTVEVLNETHPVAKTRSYISWDIETIFPYQENLFIGSSSGMHILDVSTPEAPQKISSYEHVRSCDPVVVDDNYAYVTLRSGTTCQGFTNQLEIIDISNLATPRLLKTYPMTNPHGLGIDDKTLFICDGADGLKAYDATDIYTIDSNQLAHYRNIEAYDVIPYNNILMMIGLDGIFQFDYTDPKDIKLLSKIELSREQ